MKKEVIVIDTDRRQFHDLCEFLSEHHFTTVKMNAMRDVESYLCASNCRAVILNLDNVRVTNKSLRDLKRRKPQTNIIVLSERQLHPELEEAFREYISVCLKQPWDSDELVYWLQSIFKNDEDPSG